MDTDPDAEKEEDTLHDGHPEIKETTFQIVGTVSNPTGEKCGYTEEEYNVNVIIFTRSLQQYAYLYVCLCQRFIM